MAKKSVIRRENKREELIEKFSKERITIKNKLQQCYKALSDSNSNYEATIAEIEQMQKSLDSMPRNSSAKRKRNRCLITGRPRGVYRHFKIGRNMLRKYAMMGLIPGIRKSSW